MEGAREDLRERERPRRIAKAIRRLGLATVADQGRLRVMTRLLDLYVRSGAQRAARASRLLPKRLRGMESLAMKAEGTPYVPVERPDADTAFFAGCIMRTAFGETERATVRLLERGGARVTACGEQTCCGALHAHAGERGGARDLAKRNIEILEPLPVDAFIVNAAGCGANLKEYGWLLKDQPGWAERGERFSARVKDASEYLAAVGLAEQPGPVRATAAYDDPCHLIHGQKISAQPRALLASIPELSLVPLAEADWCCGSAGTYNVTQPELAARLGHRKAQHIVRSGAAMVVTANPGCQMQIEAALRREGSRVPVVHLMDLLDRAYASR
jgi:glycolate oxidase iron-sulfur subunit